MFKKHLTVEFVVLYIIYLFHHLYNESDIIIWKGGVEKCQKGFKAINDFLLSILPPIKLYTRLARVWGGSIVNNRPEYFYF